MHSISIHELRCGKHATAVRELNGISPEDWEQKREAIILEHSTNGAREQRSAGWKCWLLATDQKGWGCAVKDIQSLGGAPEVLADWWPTVLCVEPAVVGQIFSGTVILEWRLCSHKCVHQDCLLYRIYMQTYTEICGDVQCICKSYATHMQIYALCKWKYASMHHIRRHSRHMKEEWKDMQSHAFICSNVRGISRHRHMQ